MADFGHHGGGRRGGRGGGGGYKRRREDEQHAPDSNRLLLASLISLGDGSLPTLEVDEDTINSLTKLIKKEARADANTVFSMLLDCAVQLSTKAPLYALVTGLLNVDAPDVVDGLLQRIADDISACLRPGGDVRQARLLLRFVAALVVTNVVHASAAVAVIQSFVDTALGIAAASPDGDDGRLWQPYSDHLVYMALTALPWGGPELADSVPAEMQALCESVDAYMERRPRVTQPSLRPFAEAIKEDDPIAESDNGGASFLPEVVSAIKQMVEERYWQLDGIPRVHIPLEPTLAEGQPHALPGVAISKEMPVATPDEASALEVGAAALTAFPPRGIIHLLDRQHTFGSRPAVERLVAEEYMLDTMAYFEADRVECAKRLAKALPLPYAYEPLLCEVVFGQMLRIPAPQLKPVMYFTLMVELCKLMKLVPRAMSACVRECFARMNVMDPALRLRLAEWLAYHLSNFEYLWPWPKWQHVLDAPAFDGQRRFCVAVMNRLIRLSYWDRIHAVIPDNFQVLLPPKPEASSLPAEDEMTEDVEGTWAAKMLAKVRAKATQEEIDAWLLDSGIEAAVGGRLAVLRVVARCLLVAGAKSYTHMVIALERYYGPLAMLVKELAVEGEVALISTVVDVWRKSPQRASMAVDRLMTLRLLTAEAIVTWVFQSEGALSLRDESLTGLSWEVLYNAVNKSIARVQDAQDDLTLAQQNITHFEAVEDPAKLELCQQDVAEKEGYLAEASSILKAVVRQVLQSFMAILTDATLKAREGDTSDEASAFKNYTLACLVSFLRRYFVQVAGVAEDLEADLAAASLPHDIAAAVRSQLRM